MVDKLFGGPLVVVQLSGRFLFFKTENETVGNGFITSHLLQLFGVTSKLSNLLF
jgi:hypothetical protein